jgi:hypothetical protein
MSNPTLHSDSNRHDESNTTERPMASSFRQFTAPVVSTGQMVGFWTAIGIPFLYLPLLSVGTTSKTDLLVFGALLVVNVLALLAGRGHRRD